MGRRAQQTLTRYFDRLEAEAPIDCERIDQWQPVPTYCQWLNCWNKIPASTQWCHRHSLTETR